MKNIKIRFYSTKLAKKVGDYHVKTIYDAIKLNSLNTENLNNIRLDVLECLALCENLLAKNRSYEVPKV